jgi:hypothetical protein
MTGMTTEQLQCVKSFGELAGATIERVTELGSRLVLHLQDGRIAIIGVDRGWESGDEELELQAAGDLDAHDQVKAGLLPKEEYDRRQQAERERAALAKEARDRQQYEALKQKYGS